MVIRSGLISAQFCGRLTKDGCRIGYAPEGWKTNSNSDLQRIYGDVVMGCVGLDQRRAIFRSQKAAKCYQDCEFKKSLKMKIH